MNVFMISGWERTGSTLLTRLLDGHPDLYVHPEAGFDFQPIERWRWPEYSVAIRDRNFSMAYETTDTPPLRKMFWESKLGRIDHSKYNDQLAEFDFDFEKFLKSWREDVEAAENWTEELIISSYLRRYFECLHSHPKRDTDKYLMSQTRMGFDYDRFFEIFPKGKLLLTRRNFQSRMISYIGLGRVIAKPGMVSRPRMPHSLVKDLWRVYRQAREQKFQDYIIENTKNMDSVFVCDYEDLVADSEGMMRKVADFLELPFDEILLSPTVYGREWLSNSSFTRPTEYRGKVDPGRARRKYWTNLDKKIINTIYRATPVPPPEEILSLNGRPNTSTTKLSDISTLVARVVLRKSEYTVAER